MLPRREEWRSLDGGELWGTRLSHSGGGTRGKRTQKPEASVVGGLKALLSSSQYLRKKTEGKEKNICTLLSQDPEAQADPGGPRGGSVPRDCSRG